jgi:hypothetical protein
VVAQVGIPVKLKNLVVAEQADIDLLILQTQLQAVADQSNLKKLLTQVQLTQSLLVAEHKIVLLQDLILQTCQRQEAEKEQVLMTLLHPVDQAAVEIAKVDHLLQELQTKVMQADREAAAELARLGDHQAGARVCPLQLLDLQLRELAAELRPGEPGDRAAAEMAAKETKLVNQELLTQVADQELAD